MWTRSSSACLDNFFVFIASVVQILGNVLGISGLAENIGGGVGASFGILPARFPPPWARKSTGVPRFRNRLRVQNCSHILIVLPRGKIICNGVERTSAFVD